MMVRLHLWSEAVSPITHMSGLEGNEAMVAREPVSTPSGRREIPCLSANGVRHRCVREPGAMWLIDRLGLAGKLTLKQLNFLLHGGNLTESTGRENVGRVAEMQEIFPLLRLLGGSLPDQILAGSLKAWRGMLVCEENRPHLPANLPDDFAVGSAALKPAEHYVAGYQYTRGDAAKRPHLYDALAGDDPNAKSNLMIYAGQQVIRGAVFSHGFEIPHGSDLELGCLLHSLTLWQQSGGTVGGMSSKGHGRLQTSILGDAPDWSLIDRYVEHVDQQSDRCRDWLDKVFAAKPEKKSKKG